jgi:hypothetical protein
MIDETGLRAKARQLIRAGGLPPHRPDRVWGGAGYGGSLCTLCNSGIGHDEVAIEVEYAPANDATARNYYLHTRCFLALEQELLLCEAAGPAAFQGAADGLHPSGTRATPAAFPPDNATLP